MTNHLELKRFLAERLKGKLHVTLDDAQSGLVVRWNDEYTLFTSQKQIKRVVLETEWLAIVRLVEETLDSEKNLIPDSEGFQSQWDKYIQCLEEEVSATCAEEEIYYKTITADWDLRATALRAVLKD